MVIALLAFHALYPDAAPMAFSHRVASLFSRNLFTIIGACPVSTLTTRHLQIYENFHFSLWIIRCHCMIFTNSTQWFLGFICHFGLRIILCFWFFFWVIRPKNNLFTKVSTKQKHLRNRRRLLTMNYLFDHGKTKNFMLGKVLLEIEQWVIGMYCVLL